MGYLVLWPVDWTEQKSVDGGRRLLTGRSDDMAADIAGARDRQVCAISALRSKRKACSETLERMQRFAEQVSLPLVR